MYFCLKSSVRTKVRLCFQRSSFLFAPLFCSQRSSKEDSLKLPIFVFLQSVRENFVLLKFILLKWLVLFVCGWKERVEQEKKVSSISLKSLLFLQSFSILYCFFRFRKNLSPNTLFHLFQLQAISSQIPKSSLVSFSFAHSLLQCSSFPKIFFLCEVIFLLKEFLHLL